MAKQSFSIVIGIWSFWLEMIVWYMVFTEKFETSSILFVWSSGRPQDLGTFAYGDIGPFSGLFDRWDMA